MVLDFFSDGWEIIVKDKCISGVSDMIIKIININVLMELMRYDNNIINIKVLVELCDMIIN